MTRAALDLGTAGLREMARMLAISSERVRQLANDGVVAKVARDKFDIARSVRGYLNFLKEEARRRSNPTKDRLIRAKCAAVETRIARIVDSVIEREDVEAVTTDIIKIFREEFAGLGEKCGAPAAIAARINRQIADATARCDRDLRRAIARLR